MARTEVNGPALENQLKYNQDVTSALDKIGKAIAEDAAILAPKRTGAGARSIRHEVGHDTNGPYVHVSWDRRHFYMQFHELGTSEKSAHPFLRPAAEKPRTV